MEPVGDLLEFQKGQIFGARRTKNSRFQGYDSIHKSWEDKLRRTETENQN